MQNDSIPSGPAGAPPPVIKVIGLGDAGVNIVAALSGAPPLKLLACNTDAAAIAQLAGVDKVAFGRKTTRGLSAGGDPERGRAAADEDAAKFKAACVGASLVFVIAGLGGGTGTGAAPAVARAARQSGALVLAFVAMPFEFEGAKRQRLALAGLEELKQEADAVVVVPNERMQHLLDSSASLEDTFRGTNALLADGVKAVARLLTTRGLINLDFASLAAAVRGRHAESVVATAEISGAHRAVAVVEKLLQHPMLDDGEVLKTADWLLVSVAGGPGFSFGDVNAVMRELNGHCGKGNLTMGAIADPALEGRLSITVIATERREAPAADVESEPPAAMGRPSARRASLSPVNIDTEFLKTPEPVRPRRGVRPPPPDLSPEQQQQILARHARPGARRRRHTDLQQQLPLEIVSKGRFEKSEPTIHHGEDLDVPTFIRRGMVLN